MTHRRAAGFALAAATCAFLFGAQAALAQGAPPAPPVQVAAPLAKKVTNWDEYTGRFEAAERPY